MENSVQQDSKSTEELIQWYIDMIENYPNTFVHYLSEEALLQWFGRSIKGPEKILYFIKSNMGRAKHLLNVSYSPDTLKKLEKIKLPIPKESSTNVFLKNIQTKIDVTPESNISKVNIDFFEKDELAGGDGPNIDKLPTKHKTEIGQGDCSTKMQNRTIHFLETSGSLEFYRTCHKKGIVDTKWERSCTLKIGYVGNLSNPVDFNIHLIIYGDNMPCRKNLLPEFEKCLFEE